MNLMMAATLLVNPVHAEKRPERLWRGMDQINDKYDWLRPPAVVVERIITQVHSGKVTTNSLQYRYKRTINFDGVNRIFALWLHTPVGSVADDAKIAREEFKGKPQATVLAERYRDAFEISINVRAFGKDDVPNAVVAFGASLIRPQHVVKDDPMPALCADYGDLPCWYNFRSLTFVVGPTERAAGPASIVFRWHGVERIVPINLDRLW